MYNVENQNIISRKKVNCGGYVSSDPNDPCCPENQGKGVNDVIVNFIQNSGNSANMPITSESPYIAPVVAQPHVINPTVIEPSLVQPSMVQPTMIQPTVANNSSSYESTNNFPGGVINSEKANSNVTADGTQVVNVPVPTVVKKQNWTLPDVYPINEVAPKTSSAIPTLARKPKEFKPEFL